MVQISYEKRVVCFIDILGFTKMIKDTTDSENLGKLLNVCDAIKRVNIVQKIIEKINFKNATDDIRTSLFSDSIVISFPYNEDDDSILAIFYLIKYIQVNLIKDFSILLRGGIVIGDVIHNNELLVGPAMIDAHILESKCAFSPRILIDPTVATLYNKTLKKRLKEKTWKDTTVIHKDSDNTSYIDYFNFTDNTDLLTHNELITYFEQLCKMIAQYINHNDMSIRVKYLWMQNKLQSSNLYKRKEFADIYNEIVGNNGKKIIPPKNK